jgi:hypothetical protein
MANPLIITAKIFALTTFLIISACSTEATQGAKQGAASGAAVGAVGGMVTALVFGGDVAEAAARGAVWGGSTGAVSGGMRGEQVAEQKRTAEQQQKEKALAKLRKEIGDDAYRGLEALADCNYTVAKAYADTAQKNSNKNYALSGYWLEVLAVAEEGRISDAEAMLPELVRVDRKVKNTEQAKELVGESMDQLGLIRESYGMNSSCNQ